MPRAGSPRATRMSVLADMPDGVGVADELLVGMAPHAQSAELPMGTIRVVVAPAA